MDLALGSPYFVLLAVAFAAAFAFSHAWAPRLGLARLAVTDVCIAALVGGLVGSRALHVAVEPLPADPLPPARRDALRARAAALDPAGREVVLRALQATATSAVWEFVAEMPPGAARDQAAALAARDPERVPARLWYRARPLEALAFWKGGLAYLGGLACAAVLGGLVAWRHGAPVGDMANLAAPAVALGLAVGRVGCVLGGCCYGRACAPAWWSTPVVGDVHRIPTAALESLYDLTLFFGLLWLLPRRRAPWELFLALLALYAPGRFALEALRDDPRGGALGLSTSQWLVLVSGVPAALAWAWLRLRPAPPAPAQGAAPARPEAGAGEAAAPGGAPA